MSIPRIHSAEVLTEGSVIRLDKTASKHLHVLRLKPGDEVMLFNGLGGHYQAMIAAIRSDGVTVDIGRHVAHETESPLEIILAQGISRGERMDYTIQKSVELGVTTIIPLLTERCGLKLSTERAEKRLLHWQGVIASACEQCGRNRLPTIRAVDSLRNWLSQLDGNGLKLVMDFRDSNSLSHIIRPVGAITLLIGPEGGLTDAELAQAKDAGFTGIRLGPRILRTETAGIAAICSLQSLWGDLV